MPKERYYHPQDYHIGQVVTVEGDECHHMVKVMRQAVGERVELINGMGALAIAKILQCEKKAAKLQIEELVIGERAQGQLILAQGLPRLSRLELIVEKGTELGMDALWLFPGARSEKKELSDAQLARLQSLAAAAMKQCGRLYMPTIMFGKPLTLWEAPSFPFYYGSLAVEAPWFLEQLARQKSSNMLFCVGPEGGLNSEEEAALKRMGAIGVKLHSNTLRTETAAIAALTLMSQGISHKRSGCPCPGRDGLTTHSSV
jgi:16S rRNA (uracil1498-N3)-methyltransferase